ncbi:MAG: Asp-tRNA(Asn)/Glu-tRNA(Gln) amidotransferase subunit GatC [Chthoniobacterales bacterium]
MAHAEIDVRKIARLARLQLTDEEAHLFQEQLSQVLAHADKLRAVDVSGVETSAHASPIFDLFRADEVRPSLSAGAALANAPRQANDLFIVPKVVE